METIEDTILSVVSQEYPNIEFIIIDGCSTDGTLEIIKRFRDKIDVFISEPDNGIYDAMNKGISLSTGEFIYFLGADDVLTNNTVIKNIVCNIETTYEIYYGNVIFKTSHSVYDGKFSQLKIVNRNISHQSIFYPRVVFDEFLFDLNYPILADYNLNLQLFNHTRFKFKYVPLVVAIFNDNGVSGSRTLDSNFEKDRLDIIYRSFPLWVYVYKKMRMYLVSRFIKR